MILNNRQADVDGTCRVWSPGTQKQRQKQLMIENNPSNSRFNQVALAIALRVA
jgi:hypothetical protein